MSSSDDAIKRHRERMAQIQGQAEAGDLKAMFELGTLIEVVATTHQEYAEGLVWIQRAASAGYSSSSFYLGDRASQDKTISSQERVSRAMLYYQAAAQTGSIQAKFRLIELHQGQDPTLAAECLRTLKDTNNPWAHYLWGHRCVLGDGVPQDVAEGLSSWVCSAKQGEVWAVHALIKWWTQAPDGVEEAGFWWSVLAQHLNAHMVDDEEGHLEGLALWQATSAEADRARWADLANSWVQALPSPGRWAYE